MSMIIGNKIATAFKLRHSHSGKYFVNGKDFVAEKIEDASTVNMERAIYYKSLYEKYTGFQIDLIPVA